MGHLYTFLEFMSTRKLMSLKVENSKVRKKPIWLHCPCILITPHVFRVTVWLAGLDSRVFHATNLALHLAVVLLLHSTLAARLLLSPATAAVAAALFAVHPVHAEAVSTDTVKWEVGVCVVG